MADWIGINSSHLDSYCGHGDNMPLSNALDGTGLWYHFANDDPTEHYFIIDLGKSYHISKLRGRSNTADDPNDIDAYISDDKENWGSRVMIGRTSWASRTDWGENDCVEKSGRYILVDVQATEGVSDQIQWGGSPSFQIFDAYGYIAVTLAGSVSAVSGASGSLSIEKELNGSVVGSSGASGYMDINPASGGVSVGLIGSADAVSNCLGELDLQPLLAGSADAASNCLGELDLQPLLAGLTSANSSSSGSLDVLAKFVGAINTVSNLLGNLNVSKSLTSSITCESNTASELDVDYEVYTNPAAEKWYDMIQRLGVEANITVHPVEAFNPVTQNTVQHRSREFTVKVIPPYRNREGRNETEMITSGVGLTGIANFNLEFVVEVGMKITITSKVWTVTGIQPVTSKDGILVYILEIDSGN